MQDFWKPENEITIEELVSEKNISIFYSLYKPSPHTPQFVEVTSLTAWSQGDVVTIYNRVSKGLFLKSEFQILYFIIVVSLIPVIMMGLFIMCV